ncbi:efflux RND transporter permease subunit [Prosthecochloris sp. SCSIO W1101]|uniref:efflux RND transporter permease subunit n=1 Tax=Prosthecochloris sp. SCSIO W1101 TaxID=2992242 RepID=UPI00223D5934|nr:efflux RND transporter permease subunit [Prosthecochloris sp. SCSIO W1101]UZJ41761.1 efflux RND transporter permease subunit [Prosthecochloris sp. SCSIO W1101]
MFVHRYKEPYNFQRINIFLGNIRTWKPDNYRSVDVLDRVIAFFIHRHLLTNMVFVAVLAAGLLAWSGLKKEELPDITFDTVRISVNYPGASAEELNIMLPTPLRKHSVR